MMTENFTEEERQRLIQELNLLEQQILRLGENGKERDETKDIQVLIRICPGLTDKELSEILSSLKLSSSWLNFPLEEEKYLVLLKIQDLIRTLSLAKDHDPLTNLYNRGYFEHILAREIKYSKEFNSPVTLSIMDIDDFKKINDQYGHPCGDTVLKRLADILRSNIRSTDYAARIGGEEFALILPGTGLLRSRAILNRILEEIQNTVVCCSGTKHKIKFTLSIGAASYSGRGFLDKDEFLNIADKQLYKAKSQGKNRICCIPVMGKIEDDVVHVKGEEKKFLLS
ncbi:GGDEF domain-containing protein [Desulfovulcanus sp.]